jgi:hypothetical protein
MKHINIIAVNSNFYIHKGINHDIKNYRLIFNNIISEKFKE